MQQRHWKREQRTEDGLAAMNVSHGFADNDVLDEVTFALDPGETVAIIGPSGTGKTTLLRLLSLFHRPDAGTVEMDGTDVWSLSERERLGVRRRVGMVFQEPNLFDAPVRRNVEYGRHVRRDWRDRITRWLSRLRGENTCGEITEALEVVGLTDAESRSASSLSGGEAQRVAFARALAYEPDVLLLDEPTSHLDSAAEERVEALLGDLIRDLALTVVMVTHDENQARRLGDRVLVLQDGRVERTGAVEEVMA